MEARLAEEAADQRARAAEIRREKRLAKIKFMEDMDDRTEVPEQKTTVYVVFTVLLRLGAVSWHTGGCFETAVCLPPRGRVSCSV